MATIPIRPGRRCRAEDRRQQILEVATELFSRQGYASTTTRQIAQGADVNEAIIFRHFPSKEELYWAVIEHKCNPQAASSLVAEWVAKDLPVEEIFAGIAREFLRTRAQDLSLSRLLLFSALERHELSQRFFQNRMARIYEELAQYIRAQIDAGNFRQVDPLIAARGFWGMVVYHFLVQELFGAKQYHEIDIDEASRTLADVWLNGMLPAGHDGQIRKQQSSKRRQSAAERVTR